MTTPPDSNSIKARLFGRERRDPVQKQLLKARVLGTLRDGHTPEPGESPTRFGRYVVQRKLGQGGMGVVYLADDVELDRKVALKLLREELGEGSQGRARMLREAQALARLSHPNVVQVYEVGRWGEHDYVAMEFVEGETLDRWLAAEPRRWVEILAVLEQAGRGLEAAHAAGLVHRDFKPSNLLVGTDGRARVLDFGLARPAEGASVEPRGSLRVDAGATEESSLDASPTDGRSPNLTASGVVLGTPAYMPPEQLLGRPANALGDQFSFCVVAYEALLGARPFAAATRAEYLARVESGEPSPGTNQARVPGWLRKRILRGLAAEPDRRWPDMRTLLAELDHDPGRVWRWLGAVASVAAAVGLAVALGGEEPSVCEPDPTGVADSWDAADHEAVVAGFAASDLPGADELGLSVAAHLDAYAASLVDARAQACRDRWVVRRHTHEQLRLREACVDQRERELHAVAEVLVGAERDAIIHAPELLAELGEVELCAEVELLAAGAPAPRDEAMIREIAAVRLQIAQAHAARDVGRQAEAEALTAAARVAAEALDYAPLLAELNLLEGRNARLIRHNADAREHLTAAAAFAQRSGQLELGAWIWINFALLVALDGVDPDTSLEFRMAEAAVAQIGAPRRQQLTLDLARGVTLVEAGRNRDALEVLDRAVAITEREPDELELTGARLLTVRARALAALGRMSESRADLERSAAVTTIRTRDQLDARFDLAVLQLEAGEVEGAEADFRAAMAGYAAVFGPRFESIGHGHLALANIALKREDHDEARAEFERAIAVFGEDHPDHDWILDGLAAVQLQTGETAAGIASLEAAIAHRAGVDPDDHGRLAYLHTRLGIAHIDAEEDL